MKIKIDETTQKIYDILSKKGETYIVGGYIRDKIIGIETQDVDIATKLSNEIVLDILKEYNPYILSKKYKIVAFKVENIKYEITQIRKESGILDGRNPLNISFDASIEEDLNRRDFTINAFAYNNEKFIDLFNAKKDIDSNTIKTIGNAEYRFLEDKLRILRAFVFMAKLNFDFDEELEKAIIKLSKDKTLFSKFSNERLIIEFNKILLHKYSYKAIYKMFELNILKFFIKEFDNRICNKEIMKQICNKYMKLFDKNNKIDIELAYATLFCFSSKKTLNFERSYENDSVYIFDDFSHKFLSKKPEYYIIKNLIYYHNIILKKPSLVMLKRMLLDMGDNKNVSKLLYLTTILFPENINDIKKIYYNIQRLYLAEEPVFLSDMDLMNVDLYTLGINNKKVIDIKLEIFRSILNGDISNFKYDILNAILKKYNIDKKLDYEKCAGAIVYREINGRYEFLIIKGSNEGSYSFPKGHIEIGEQEEETAIREVKEETNIDIEIVDSDKFKKCLKYVIAPNIFKEVHIFLAKAKNYEINIAKEEIYSAEWLTYNEAKKKLTYSYQRNILKKAMLYIYL